MKNTGSRYCITRIDNNKTEGWRVIIPGPAGRKANINKTFTDLRYQGRSQALMAAQKFRDGLPPSKEPPPMPEPGWMKERPASTEPSDRVGVFLENPRRNGECYPSWVAWFYVDGRHKTRHWFISKYGYKEAWHLATEELVKHGGFPSLKEPPPMPEWVRERLALILAEEERVKHSVLQPPMSDDVREQLASPTPRAKLRNNNISGRVGVSLSNHLHNGENYPSWEAWFHVDVQRKMKSWSISKHGYEGAWRLAVAWREQHDGLPSPKSPPPMPGWMGKWLASSQAKLSHNRTPGRRAGVFLRHNHGYAYWATSFSFAGRRKEMRWSIAKYGYEEAWHLAVDCREQHDGLPSPEAPPPIPAWVTESKGIHEHNKENVMSKAEIPTTVSMSRRRHIMTTHNMTRVEIEELEFLDRAAMAALPAVMQIVDDVEDDPENGGYRIDAHNIDIGRVCYITAVQMLNARRDLRAKKQQMADERAEKRHREGPKETSGTTDFKPWTEA